MTVDQRLRIDDSLAADIAAYQARYSIRSFAEAVRILLRKGLEAEARES
jgi:hypothetical protein